MKEYIEREAAIELGKKQSCAGIIDGGDFCNISANMLRKIPAADVVKVRHGRWEVGGMFDDIGRCSACHYMFPIDTATTEFHFCPNCGAKMDGGVDDV